MQRDAGLPGQRRIGEAGDIGNRRVCSGQPALAGILVLGKLVVQQPKDSACTGLAGSLVGPNPFASGDDLTIQYPPSTGLSCVAEIFNVAGEVVAKASDSGSGRFTIRVGHLAAGIYVCRLEKRLGSAVKARIAIKMAIVK